MKSILKCHKRTRKLTLSLGLFLKFCQSKFPERNIGRLAICRSRCGLQMMSLWDMRPAMAGLRLNVYKIYSLVVQHNIWNPHLLWIYKNILDITSLTSVPRQSFIHPNLTVHIAQNIRFITVQYVNLHKCIKDTGDVHLAF